MHYSVIYQTIKLCMLLIFSAVSSQAIAHTASHHNKPKVTYCHKDFCLKLAHNNHSRHTTRHNEHSRRSHYTNNNSHNHGNNYNHDYPHKTHTRNHHSQGNHHKCRHPSHQHQSSQQHYSQWQGENKHYQKHSNSPKLFGGIQLGAISLFKANHHKRHTKSKKYHHRHGQRHCYKKH